MKSYASCRLLMESGICHEILPACQKIWLPYLLYLINKTAHKMLSFTFKLMPCRLHLHVFLHLLFHWTSITDMIYTLCTINNISALNNWRIFFNSRDNVTKMQYKICPSAHLHIQNTCTSGTLGGIVSISSHYADENMTWQAKMLTDQVTF